MQLAYMELRAFLEGDRSPEVVTDAVAADYVDERLAKSPDSPSTCRRKLSALGAFWEWMATILRARWQKCAPPTSQLFQELRGGGYDKKLSWHVGQAFRYHRNKQGLTGETDFHSLRRTFITRLENLRVDQVRIARYVGHQLPTLAFTVYSGGSTETTQRATGKAVHYPRDVESVVR